MAWAIGTFFLTDTAAPDAHVESFPIGQAMLDMKTLVHITKNLRFGQFILHTHPSIVINASLKTTLFFDQGPVGLWSHMDTWDIYRQ